MSSSVMIMMILSLFYVWNSCSIIFGSTINYFNRNIWFNHGNIFHIEQDSFRTIFQQHRNVNRHINWLTNEISSINSQIKSIKDQAISVIHTHEQHQNFPSQKAHQSISFSLNNNSQKYSSSKIKLKNHQNIFILKLLINEKLFNEYIEELIDIYKLSLTITIECIAVIMEQNSNEKYLFIKLSNGIIDKYQMNKSQSLKETFCKIDQPILIWNNDGKQLEYYRRFIQNYKINEIAITDQLAQIKSRPKLNDADFFDMMGQILRIKYHIDPSSLSCILEVFFGNIYTCDGRLIYPHELKFLSNDNGLFVFYAVMMDTSTEKQIYPLDTNNYIRNGEQIFFLFNTHPQFHSLSSITCEDCPRYDQTYILNNNNNKKKEIESNTDNQIIESKDSVDNIVQHSVIIIPQNYIVYAIVTSIVIYILFNIYLTQKEVEEQEQELIEYSGRKTSISSRRGR